MAIGKKYVCLQSRNLEPQPCSHPGVQGLNPGNMRGSGLNPASQKGRLPCLILFQYLGIIRLGDQKMSRRIGHCKIHQYNLKCSGAQVSLSSVRMGICRARETDKRCSCETREADKRCSCETRETDKRCNLQSPGSRQKMQRGSCLRGRGRRQEVS